MNRFCNLYLTILFLAKFSEQGRGLDCLQRNSEALYMLKSKFYKFLCDYIEDELLKI